MDGKTPKSNDMKKAKSKNMERNIYVVHGVSDLSLWDKSLDKKARQKALNEMGRRTFGWYFNFEDAEKAVKNNDGDLREYFYDYIVIEEFPEGVWVCRKNEWWYKWGASKFRRIQKPNCIRNTINWGMG
jgi:hypothetical protein